MSSDQLSQLKEQLRWANSYSRAEILLYHCPIFRSGKVAGTEWFTVLGEEWDGCDNIGEFRWLFARILAKAAHQQLQAMMTEQERVAWLDLPDHIEAFRGCESGDLTGLSYSTSKNTASKFPFLNRYRANNPTLITACIPKKLAVLKLGRGEDEIISARVSIVRSEPLTEGEAA